MDCHVLSEKFKLDNDKILTMESNLKGLYLYIVLANICGKKYMPVPQHLMNYFQQFT